MKVHFPPEVKVSIPLSNLVGSLADSDNTPLHGEGSCNMVIIHSPKAKARPGHVNWRGHAKTSFPSLSCCLNQLDTNAYTRLLVGGEDVLDAVASAEMIFMSIFVLGERYAGFSGGMKNRENCDCPDCPAL